MEERFALVPVLTDLEPNHAPIAFKTGVDVDSYCPMTMRVGLVNLVVLKIDRATLEVSAPIALPGLISRSIALTHTGQQNYGSLQAEVMNKIKVTPKYLVIHLDGAAVKIYMKGHLIVPARTLPLSPQYMAMLDDKLLTLGLGMVVHFCSPRPYEPIQERRFPLKSKEVCPCSLCIYYDN